jgi:LuxR family maltose regulon positive regulatory protein
MAQVRAARGDPEGAVRLLEQAAVTYRHGFYPDVRPIDAMKARIQVCAGDLASAATWAQERDVRADQDVDYLHEYEHLTLARLLLARARVGRRSGKPETLTLTTVLTLLGRLHDAAAGPGRDGSLLEIRVLQALAHHAGGDRDTALRILGQALTESPEPDSHVRLYLDEGAPMQELLRDAAAGSGEQHETVQAWARRLLQRAQPTVDGPGARPFPADPLSQREVEVLRLLASELTGPEIAQELYVSLNTLRTHTKRIFTKLDVRTRAAAVRRAREHGLL